MQRTGASPRLLARLLIAVVLAGCSSQSSPSVSPNTVSPNTVAPNTVAPNTVAPTSTSAAATTARTETTTTTAVPRPPTTSAPASFHAWVATVTAADLPSTYRPGCPVGPARLRMLHLSYWGFDDRPHTGTIVVAASVAVPVVAVFRTLYDRRFPIRQMRPEDAFSGSDPASMTADNTSGFNCRNAVAPGAPRWSAHAYGTAIDVNSVENPYLEGGLVQPANGAAFVDRGNVRPGMAEPNGPLNRAFAAIGWQWGGRWTGAPDYQHFSADGG